jgi:Holliday junction DNA helicase RuvA
LATRILSELKDKVSDLALDVTTKKSSNFANNTSDSGNAPSNLSDAASALINLGYGPSEALGAVSRAAANMDGDPDVQELISKGLRELAPVDR